MALFGIVGAIGATGHGGAQTTDEGFGTPDSVFQITTRVPVSYVTSYDRDRSSGTWAQSLSYGLNRPRVAFTTGMNYSAVDQFGPQAPRSAGGSVDGQLAFKATRNWLLSLVGHFTSSSSGGYNQEQGQRRNRINITTQYNLSPWRGFDVRGALSTEFQRDHSRTIRAPGEELPKLLFGETGPSTLYVRRDSTVTSARQDGFSGRLDWALKPWLRLASVGFGSRVRPTITSYLGGLAESKSGSWKQGTDRIRGNNPNGATKFETKLTYVGARGVQSWVTIQRSHNESAYSERSLLGQELARFDQRAAILHLQHIPLPGTQVTVDGSLDRASHYYRLKPYQNSLVSGKSMKASVSYDPNPNSRAGLEFDLEHHRNSQQQSGNGINLVRFIQATGGRRLSRRLSVDGVATASLISFQYENSKSDKDNVRSYLNFGGSYRVSDRCSTTVHFSATRAHEVAIDAARSSDNNMQSTYQMAASLRLGVTPTLSVTQIYVLTADYKIYDLPSKDPSNTLSTNRRIDTTVSDSLFSFATFQLVHNFFFRDFGFFSTPPGGTERAYRVSSLSYVQTVTATLNLKPAPGVIVFASQALANTKISDRSSQSWAATNRWLLTIGATIDRTISGNASIRGTVQHNGAYNEEDPRDLQRRDINDWTAGVMFVKEF